MRQNLSVQRTRAVVTGTRREITMRTTVSVNFLWSAVCSACPNWKVTDEAYSVYRSEAQAHRIGHARKGLVVL